MSYRGRIPTGGFRSWVIAGAGTIIVMGFIIGIGDGFDFNWILTMLSTTLSVVAVTFIAYWFIPRFGQWVRRNFGRGVE